MVNDQDKSLEQAALSLIREDQINIYDYIKVLWKYKWLVLFATVFPTFVAYLILSARPTLYETTYTFSVCYTADPEETDDVDTLASDISGWHLSEENFQILRAFFFSRANMDRIQKQLPGKDFQVQMGIWHPYMEASKKRTIRIEELRQVEDVQASLLKVTVTSSSREELLDAGKTILNNIQNTIPLHLIQQDLLHEVIERRDAMAKIGEEAFEHQMIITEKEAILKQLQREPQAVSGQQGADILLQLDGRRNREDTKSYLEYFPWSRQMVAVRYQIAETNAQIQGAQLRYAHNEKLIGIAERLIGTLEELKGSAHPVETLESRCMEWKNNASDEDVKAFLNVYMLRISNRINASLPLTDAPEIIAHSRGTFKATAGAFVLFLTLSIVAAFLLEGRSKNGKS